MCAAGFTFNVFIKSYETISVVISETRVSGECAESPPFHFFLSRLVFTHHMISRFFGCIERGGLDNYNIHMVLYGFRV